jgi:acylphosphatase
METKKAFRAIVKGVVQGVGFRYYTLRKAHTLENVTGFVKNLPDGSVEVVAEGPEPALLQLLKHIERGPLGSEVESVDVEWRKPGGKYEQFTINL